MSASKYKVESGIQMLLRLTKKPELSNFYPNLFKNGPKQGHVIEIYSEDDTFFFLCDIICEAIIPAELGGKESGVIIFNTDGKFNLFRMEEIIKNKLASRLSDLSVIDSYLQNILTNIFIFEIYDATQFYATIQNLDGILMNHSNISLIVFDTLTAFYWSEQSFKIMRMDVYLKYLRKIIQKAVRDYKVITIYTRPKYFSSCKEEIENLEACYEHPDNEHLNYRIQVLFTDCGIHHTIIRTYNDIYKGSFKIEDNNIMWC